MTITDHFGVEILPTDTVMVTSWGGSTRLVDTGIKRTPTRFGRTRVYMLDADMVERGFERQNLSVLRRDGAEGFEGNRQ